MKCNMYSYCVNDANAWIEFETARLLMTNETMAMADPRTIMGHCYDTSDIEDS